MITSRMPGLAVAAVLAGSIACSGPAQAGSKQDWDTLSTGLVLGLGGVAAGVTAGHSDWTGAGQLALGLGTTLLATEALKAAVDEERPDHSGNDSFPSGHTALAFAAAAYVGRRYGGEYPALVPTAYGAAALTGLARVEADKHYPRDVLAGAAIGWGLGTVFSAPFGGHLSILPQRDGAVMSYSMRF
ncbi:phosphatase PAP2 family protein [Mangrovicoccus sp. HB161399]|uniref:phosphatase PAP2 family protein n=1 Tax=Mangrovicoccus sp. HB161399 TaxID=2720392 RepID=UPI001C1305E8|nr:phosphatase PAP2 family protein [Mangrovicoccus sp. HB161399]